MQQNAQNVETVNWPLLIKGNVQTYIESVRCIALAHNKLVESSWNVMAHGDARGGEVKGKLANGVGNQ
jgi:hypothetical protein